jgi:hypothetical protein
MQRGLVAHGAGIALSCTRPWGDRSYDGVPIACRPITEKLAPQRVVIADLGQGRQSPLAAAFLVFARSK